MANETLKLTLDGLGNNISIEINDTSNDPSYTIAVGASYSSAYTMSGSDRNGSVSGNNPPINLNVFDTVNFVVNAPGHPFLIKTAQQTGIGNNVPGVVNNGAMSGTVSWTPVNAGTYYYNCRYHSSMTGVFTVS
jgi:plastocyanin